MSGSYATLSHTWGGASFKVLNAETVSQFRAGIPFQEFPATFHDAIYVARFLKIPYLWIDCYCIMQSKDTRSREQNEEIAAMADVYTNAILNIGAACATTPNDGCFVRREPVLPTLVELRPQILEGNKSYLVCDKRELQSAYGQLNDPDCRSIFSRAWCLQERFLCPRMLYFAKAGLFWECETTDIAFDAQPIAMDPERILGSSPLEWRAPFSALYYPGEDEGSVLRSKTRNDEGEVREHGWNSVVEAYSTMDLSRVAEDKFAACGGVAKLFANFLKDGYVAGFFLRSLVHNLPWQVRGATYDENRDWPHNRAQVWRAPSWSWASIDGGIDMDLWFGLDRSLLACCRLLAIEHRLADAANPYGAITSATLTLSGPVLDVKISAQSWTNSRRAAFQRHMDELDVVFDDANEPRENLIILLTTTSAPGREGPIVHGLVLAPVAKLPSKGGQKDLYQRVGAFREAAMVGPFSRTPAAPGHKLGKVSGTEHPEHEIFGNPSERVIRII